jgi:nucleoside-diphosphate-sugar epimerase
MKITMSPGHATNGRGVVTHLVDDPAIETRPPRRPTRDWSELLSGRRYLVTGAGGFIGGHLLRTLADLDLDVVGTVLYPEEAETLRGRGYEIQVLDLASEQPWDDLLQGVDVVFNIAARFQETEDGEDVYSRVNHHGALKLVRTAASAGVSRFVHCSTVGVHGDVKEIPATENSPFNPMDLYHRTKLDGELAIQAFTASLPPDGMIVTINRPAMVYGPGDRRMLKLFRSIASGKFRMIGSGEVLAHLGFIDDQTESFLLSAVGGKGAVHGEAFNIASGDPLTLNDVVHMIAAALGVNLSSLRIPVAPVWAAAWGCEMLCRPFRVKPPLFRRRVGFFTHNRAFDLSKAEDRLDYRSQWPHEDGVRTTVAWYRGAGWL